MFGNADYLDLFNVLQEDTEFDVDIFDDWLNEPGFPVLQFEDDPDGGGFVVTWYDTAGQSGSRGGSGHDVFGQVYGANGAPVGGEFLVNSYTYSSQQDPSVAATSGGGFVVTWSSNSQEGSSYGVYSQRYDADGLPISTTRLTGGAADDDRVRGARDLHEDDAHIAARQIWY